MLNEKQINLLINAIEAEKNSLLNEIMKINRLLIRKSDGLDRIEQYHYEYVANQPNRISFKIPSLCQNYEKFLKKIQSTIEIEKKLIEDFQKNRNQIFLEIDKINNRIKAIQILLDKIKKLSKNKNEMNNEIDQNDFLSHKMLGEIHD